MLLLSGQYKSDVIEKDASEEPIEGQSKTLQCVNSTENEGNPRSSGTFNVRWTHKWNTVQNNARHEGTSTRVNMS